MKVGEWIGVETKVDGRVDRFRDGNGRVDRCRGEQGGWIGIKM